MRLRVLPIIVVSPELEEAQQIAGWLRGAGLNAVCTARTCDEAIFMVGRGRPSLLIIDEGISPGAERRLLRHIEMANPEHRTVLVRLIGKHSQNCLATDRPTATQVIRKPLLVHDVMSRIGTAMQQPDLLARLDESRDQTAQHLQAARQMQIGLMPSADGLKALQDSCGVGVAALYRSGEEIGGDFWGIWPTGRGRFALAIADFVGHGLTAALNTFRLHALLSDQTLPRAKPTHMTGLLNDRLHALLPLGQYATMVYLLIDPIGRRVAWCGAGGPPPLLVSADRADDLEARGLPLGVRARTAYRRHWTRLPEAGVLAVFSDGLFESGAADADIPRAAMADALVEPVRLAAKGDLAAAAKEGTIRLDALRNLYPCTGHSDDVMAICVAFGPTTLGLISGSEPVF